MWGKNLAYEVDNLIKSRLDESEGNLCGEWAGQIELEGIVLNSTLFGTLADIPALAKGNPWSSWDNQDKARYLQLIEPISDVFHLQLHYIPKVDCWLIRSGKQEHLLSRKMTEGNNKCIFRQEVFIKDHERLEIEVYERSGIINVEKKRHESRLAFCLIFSKGVGIENKKDGSFIVAEYPLPEKLVLNAKGQYVTDLKGYEEKLNKLGWKDRKDGLHDVYTDYFGDPEMIRRETTYENKGVTVQRLI